MKLALAVLTVTFSSLALSKSLPFFAGDQVVLDDSTDLNVPGDNPLVYCQDPSDNILAIEHVNLTPNPPESGQKLTIEASGTFSQDVEEGAKVHIEVKWNLVKLINTEEDLCTQIKNVDLECPIKKGQTNITKVVEIPAGVPPGTYRVLADVYTKNKDPITCLQATAQFGRNRR